VKKKGRPMIEVKRQTELGSTQWGIYLDGRLVEGGFFSRDCALIVADSYRAEIAQRDRWRHDE